MMIDRWLFTKAGHTKNELNIHNVNFQVYLQNIFHISPSELLFDPISPIFELGLDIIKVNILTKFQHAQVKHAVLNSVSKCLPNLT